MGKTGINNSNLKRLNRGLILKLVATGECTSRIELAKKTSLSKMSVTNIVSEFLESDILAEEDIEPMKGQGRNPICLNISKKAPKIIGLFVHREECTAVLCDMKLNILKSASVSMNDENSGRLLELLIEVIDQVMPEDKEERLWGIGVGAVGPVDIKRGMILNPPNFFGIRDFEIAVLLYEHYRLPVYIDSQYNCAAQAEKYFGIGKQYHDFIFLGITNGIGSGIIADDKVFVSSNGLTSELGHVSIDINGNQCTCGNRGCLETYAGARIVEEKLRRATGKELGFREFCARAADCTEDKTDAIFRGMMEQLACAVTSSVNLLNPQAVIVGHEGCFLPDKYLAYLEELVNRQKLAGDYRYVTVRRSSMDEEAHLRGCACSVLNRIFEGKLL